jgi:8-oxo-dGTP diphosphatase
VADSAAPVQAAGGVAWRGERHAPQIAIVHRPRYDDWSLPKGKVARGETPLDAAVRELGEELGARTSVSRRLGRVSYDVEVDGASRRKRVTYWTLHERGGAFQPNDEVDDVCWLAPPDARAKLSYDGDRAIVDEFTSLPVPEALVILVRHARAGKRSEWRGDDAGRPLDPSGTAQAARLARFLSYFGPGRVISADRVRCIETVTPFAVAAGLPLEVDPTFNDESYLDAPAASVTAALALAKPGQVTVVCSQGLTIPSLVDALGPGIVDSDTRKGSAWVLSMVDGEVIAADHYDDAAGPRS